MSREAIPGQYQAPKGPDPVSRHSPSALLCPQARLVVKGMRRLLPRIGLIVVRFPIRTTLTAIGLVAFAQMARLEAALPAQD
jgi:hypothetical protein